MAATALFPTRRCRTASRILRPVREGFSEDFRRGNEGLRVNTDKGLGKRDHGVDPLRPEEARRAGAGCWAHLRIPSCPAPGSRGVEPRVPPPRGFLSLCARGGGSRMLSAASYPRKQVISICRPLMAPGCQPAVSEYLGDNAPWQVFRAWDSRDAVVGLVCAIRTEFPLSARSITGDFAWRLGLRTAPHTGHRLWLVLR